MRINKVYNIVLGGGKYKIIQAHLKQETFYF